MYAVVNAVHVVVTFIFEEKKLDEHNNYTKFY